MNEQRGQLPPALSSLRAQALQRWATLATRERLAVALAGGVLAIWLVWGVGVAPALRTLAQSRTQIDALDRDLQTMQALAAESRELRNVAPVPVSQAMEILRSATERMGGVARIAAQGDRVTLTFDSASAEQLRAWLNEARSGAHARPVESQLTRGPKGYLGSVVVVLGGAT